MSFLNFNKGSAPNKPAVRPSRPGASAIFHIGQARAKMPIFGGDDLGPIGMLCCVLFALLAALILDFGVLPPPFVANSVAPADYPARVSFTYADPEELSRQRNDAAARAPHVYLEDPDWAGTVLGDFDRLLAIATAATSEEDLRLKAAAQHFVQDYKSLLEAFYKSKDIHPERVSEMLHTEMRQYVSVNAILVEDDYRAEINKPEPRQIEVLSKKPGAPQIKVVDSRQYARLHDATYTIQHGGWADLAPWDLSRSIQAYLETSMKAALRADPDATKARQRAARDTVGSGDVSVTRGDLILEKNQPIRAQALEKLRQEFHAVKAAEPLAARARQLAGLLAFVAATLAVFLVVSARLEPGVLKRHRALAMLAAFVLVTLAVCRGLLLAGVSLACAPFIIVAMTASLAFGQAVALPAMLGLTLLAILASINWQMSPLDGGLPFISVALFTGAVVASISSRRLRTRLDLLRYGLLGGALQGLLMAAFTLFNNAAAPSDVETLSVQWPHSGLPVLMDAAIAFVNGPLCGLLVLGGLPLIEALFGIITNIRLFELADLDQPALQRIQLEAPGTFSHTLAVRFLAEPASEAIGAHTRLVSAGVLYHDLGKVLKPEYFVENSIEAEERHARLKPSVSALLIISHVKDGVDLAHEYKLPPQIVDFIPEHHGTTLVSYFYHTAVKHAEEHSQEESGSHGGAIEEAFFRYPGPKPRSRETAIVMLADTVDAASRTLHNASATRLQQFVHDLIMEKLLDNQLDECGLTFQDLALIEDAFLRVLVNRYHSRIRYPNQDEPEPEPAPERDSREGGDDISERAAASATEHFNP